MGRIVSDPADGINLEGGRGAAAPRTPRFKEGHAPP